MVAVVTLPLLLDVVRCSCSCRVVEWSGVEWSGVEWSCVVVVM